LAQIVQPQFVVAKSNPGNVLLVDDDVFLSNSVVEMLSLLAYRVTWVATLEEAIRVLASNHTYGVMLLDLRLGNDRGERIVDVAAENHVSLPPVVIFSAQPDTELGTAAVRTNAKAVLRKPCSLAGMRLALAKASAQP
jgi:DNA-binding NtrC family response regulator